MINLNRFLHKTHDMHAFAILVLCLRIASCAVFIGDISRQLRSRDRLTLYSKLEPVSSFVGKYDVTPYSYDEECLSVYRTNDWLFAGCELPANCSVPMIERIDKNFFGQETVLCHGVHPLVEEPVLSFYAVDFLPRSFTLSQSVEINGVVVSSFKNFMPVSFFEWFFVVKGSLGIGLVPKFCSETFRNSSSLPPNVQVHSEGDTVCLRRVLYDHHDCVPKYFKDFSSLLLYYNFPVTFDDAPFSQGSYSYTNNKVIDADLYYNENSGRTPVHVFDKVGRSYMVTYASLNSRGPVYIVKSSVDPSFEDFRCFSVHARYRSPFDHLLSKISNFLREEFEYLIDYLIVFASKIASILFTVIGELLRILTALIPYGDLFYTSVFLAFVTYLFTRDILLSTLPTVSLYFLRIYLNSVIN
ncbi:putative virion glycoprotein [Mekrijarvi negevirus]|uniref:Virion glycoprotein n=1 Tax=Mekrijarvi negevirus TaxID=2778782 RepID=A0A7L9QAU1_9VIRU|nr:putative virion glycoprotein [Mekrijarvi negevirus]